MQWWNSKAYLETAHKKQYKQKIIKIHSSAHKESVGYHDAFRSKDGEKH